MPANTTAKMLNQRDHRDDVGEIDVEGAGNDKKKRKVYQGGGQRLTNCRGRRGVARKGKRRAVDGLAKLRCPSVAEQRFSLLPKN